FGQPFLHCPFWMMTAEVGSQVRQLVFGISEGVRSRVVLDPKIRCVLRCMFQADDRLELQNLGPRSKLDQRYAISKDVVDPANLDRTRRYGDAATEQALNESVAGPE